MGYSGHVLKAACSRCGSEVVWTRELQSKLPKEWTCECRATNILERRELQPNIPPFIWIGHEHVRQLKLLSYVIPTDDSSTQAHWLPPYSIRSFVFQASAQFQGCRYETCWKGEVMGEPVFSDRCLDVPRFEWDVHVGEMRNPEAYEHSCHMVSGFTLGAKSCPLWESVSALCQTEGERRFLQTYLNLVKDRQFPMLIPQARLGISESRRPDFVAFVPLHESRFKCYAVELDQGHNASMARRDDERDLELQALGFQVIRVKPADGKSFRDLKDLICTFDKEMRRADSEDWSERAQVALELKVERSVWSVGEDLPF
jgi:hypothetical protein